MQPLRRFLELDGGIDGKEIWERYDGSRLSPEARDFLHFHVGTAGRFRTLLTESEIGECNRRFTPFLERLGYER